MGLMLLRGSLVILIAVWKPPAWTALMPGMTLAVQIALRVGVGIGALTTACGLLCATGGLCALLPPQPQAWPWVPLVLANAFALLLLGPGGYSLDARLFGRRQLTLLSTRRRHRRRP